jgi:hypothetical protein
MIIAGALDVGLSATFDPGLDLAYSIDVDPSLSFYLDLVLDVDRTEILTYLSRVLKVGCDVYVDGDLLPHGAVDEVLVTDPVDACAMTAQFTMVSPRLRMSARDLAFGDHRVQIDVRVGPPGGQIRRTLFKGHTEGLTTQGAIQDRGTFVCVTDTSEWANALGCVRLDACSGLTRAEILALHAASSGAKVTGFTVVGARRVTKPVDEKSKSTFALAQEWAPAERWRFRVSDDFTSLEIVPAPSLTGAAFATLGKADRFGDPVEAIPTRPVTRMYLTGTQVVDAAPVDAGVGGESTGEVAHSHAITSGGWIDTWVWTLHGIEFRRVTEAYGTAPTPGVTPGPPVLQLVSRETVVSTYSTVTVYGSGGERYERFTTQLLARKTTREGLGGIRASAVYGTLWTGDGGGDYYASSAATFHVLEVADETFTWDEAACQLTGSEIVLYGYYSPLVNQSHPYGYAFGDGSIRLGTYTWQEIGRHTISYAVTDASGNTVSSDTGQAWVATAKWNGAGPRSEQINEGPVEGGGSALPEGLVSAAEGSWYWHDPGGGGAFDWWLKTSGGSGDTGWTSAVPTYASGNVETYGPSSSVPNIGSVPAPPKGSASVPAIAQSFMDATVDYTAASRRTLEPYSPGAMGFAEDVDELVTIGETILRRGLSNSLTVPVRPLPFMRPVKHVKVQARGGALLDAMTGTIVHHIKPLNGSYQLEVVLEVPGVE